MALQVKQHEANTGAADLQSWQSMYAALLLLEKIAAQAPSSVRLHC